MTAMSGPPFWPVLSLLLYEALWNMFVIRAQHLSVIHLCLVKSGGC